jgi:hypothetical protein
MCGRFVSSNTPDRIASYFGATFDTEPLGENFNVAPTSDIYAVVADAAAQPVVRAFHWGLVPSWAKEVKVGSRMINARAETLAETPAFKPLLSALCQPLGCRIEPVRQLDAVVIDSSALVRLIGQLYALDVVLKNTHAWPVAVPSLELSLTDAQEQVLARRILPASDWPDAPPVLAPGETWPVKLRLSVALPEGPPMSGYRIALFYP